MQSVGARDKRITRLEALPSRPGGVEWQRTGETFGGQWARLNTEGRGHYLRSADTRIEMLK